MQALTVLSEDEKMFFEEIENFARTTIGPEILEMDEAQKIYPKTSWITNWHP